MKGFGNQKKPHRRPRNVHAEREEKNLTKTRKIRCSLKKKKKISKRRGREGPRWGLGAPSEGIIDRDRGRYLATPTGHVEGGKNLFQKRQAGAPMEKAVKGECSTGGPPHAFREEQGALSSRGDVREGEKPSALRRRLGTAHHEHPTRSNQEKNGGKQLHSGL